MGRGGKLGKTQQKGTPYFRNPPHGGGRVTDAEDFICRDPPRHARPKTRKRLRPKPYQGYSL